MKTVFIIKRKTGPVLARIPTTNQDHSYANTMNNTDSFEKIKTVDEDGGRKTFWRDIQHRTKYLNDAASSNKDVNIDSIKVSLSSREKKSRLTGKKDTSKQRIKDRRESIL